MKVKICGITNLRDALLCESLGADALGFIFYKKSKRYISPEDAGNIMKYLSPFTIKVGVFVDEPVENVLKINDLAKFNIAQLHGHEDFGYINRLDIPVIKSFRIDNNFNFEIIKKYPGVTYLLDTFSEIIPGGTGKVFNWKLIPENIINNIVLAGGVSSENIEYIYNNIKPQAVDLSSSIESMPGKKDREKTENFFNKLKQIRRT